MIDFFCTGCAELFSNKVVKWVFVVVNVILVTDQMLFWFCLLSLNCCSTEWPCHFWRCLDGYKSDCWWEICHKLYWSILTLLPGYFFPTARLLRWSDQPIQSVLLAAIIHTEASVSFAAQHGHCCTSFLCCCSETLELSSTELLNCSIR